MLVKYFIPICLGLLINKAVGQKVEMPSEKTIFEKLQFEQNKMEEKLEEKLEQRYAKLQNKLEENRQKLEEKLGKTLEGKLNEILGEKFETKLEENLLKKLEGKIVDNLGNKLEDNLLVKLETKLEEDLGKKLEGKVEETLKNKLEAKLEENLENKVERKLQIKFEDFKKYMRVEWISTTLLNAALLSDRAVVGGYDDKENHLWIVRTTIKGDLTPGKLNVNGSHAFFPYDSQEYAFASDDYKLEVFCAPPEKVRWVEGRNGDVPNNAVIGGRTSDGENLYVGRIKHQGTLIPGKVHPSHKKLYIPYNGKEIKYSNYEVMCTNC